MQLFAETPWSFKGVLASSLSRVVKGITSRQLDNYNYNERQAEYCLRVFMGTRHFSNNQLLDFEFSLDHT